MPRNPERLLYERMHANDRLIGKRFSIEVEVVKAHFGQCMIEFKGSEFELAAGSGTRVFVDADWISKCEPIVEEVE